MKISRCVGPLALLAAQLALTTTAARADLVPVPIGSLTNADIRTYTGGTNYPVAPTNLTVAGVPFNLVPLDSVANSLGVIQTLPTSGSFDIKTNLAGPTTVYTLMNSAFGAAGADIATLEFKGAKGADVTFQLIEGDNIRDHFNGGFNNSATNIIPTAFLNGSVDPTGPDRLDRQTFILPSSFANETLTDIILTPTAGSGFPTGEAFLAAVTVQTAPVAVPEPSTFLLLASGLGITGILVRRRRPNKAS